MMHVLDDTIEYTHDGKFHRANGPARIWGSFSAWWMDDKLHRYYGPCYAHKWRIHGEAVE